MPPTNASGGSGSRKRRNGACVEVVLVDGMVTPIGFIQLFHWHLLRATDGEDSQQLYLKLAKFVRSTLIVLIILVLVAFLIFGAGVAVAVASAGVPPLTAIGIGAGGTATFVLSSAVAGRAYVKAFLRMLAAAGLSALDQTSSVTEESAGSPALG